MLERLAALKAETLIFTDASNRAAVEAQARAIVIPQSSRARAHGRRNYIPDSLHYSGPIFAATLAEWKGIDPDARAR